MLLIAIIHTQLSDYKVWGFKEKQSVNSVFSWKISATRPGKSDILHFGEKAVL